MSSRLRNLLGVSLNEIEEVIASDVKRARLDALVESMNSVAIGIAPRARNPVGLRT